MLRIVSSQAGTQGKSQGHALQLHVVPLIDVAMKDLGNRLRDRLPDLRESEQYDVFLKKTFGVNAATS